MQEREENVNDIPHGDAVEAENAPDGASVAISIEVKRRGDVEKCPICGMRVDAEAYHCPTCRNYFCFHCRARTLPNDPQFQCINQQCTYYGKLVCGVCDVMTEREDAPSVYMEPEDGYWPAWLIMAVSAFVLVWYFSTFLVAIGTAMGLFFAGGWLLQRAGLNIFGRVRKVERKKTFIQHDCIQCQQPAKQIMGTE